VSHYYHVLLVGYLPYLSFRHSLYIQQNT
jgi:hypothetical protein